MPADSYRNLFLVAGIQGYDQERFARCLDALVAQEHLDVADIIGVGAVAGSGSGGKNDLYVVQKDAVHSVSESGVFKKQITARRVGIVASIANLRADQEVQKAFELYLIADDIRGAQLFKITWPMDRAGETQAEATTTPDCPCGNGSLTMDHMKDHVVNVKTTNGVEALTYDCPICGYVDGELWSRTEEGQAGAPAGLYVHLLQSHGVNWPNTSDLDRPVASHVQQK
jgi:hypothetical protein